MSDLSILYEIEKIAIQGYLTGLPILKCIRLIIFACIGGFLILCAPAPVFIPTIHDIPSQVANPNAFRLQFKPIFATHMVSEDLKYYYGDGKQDNKSSRYYSQDWQLEFLHPFSIGIVMMMPLIKAGPLSPTGYIRYQYSFRTTSFFHTLSPWLSASYTANATGWMQSLKLPYSAGIFYSFSVNQVKNESSSDAILRISGGVGINYSRFYLLNDPYLSGLHYETTVTKTPFLLRYEQIGIPGTIGYRGFFLTLMPTYSIDFKGYRDPSILEDLVHVKSIIDKSPWGFSISAGIDIKSVKTRRSAITPLP